jgi:dynamin 1-like protein
MVTAIRLVLPINILSLFLIVTQQGALILRLMTQFARDFVTSIEGTNVDISTKELSGGARIYYIFNDVFGHALASIEPTQSLENQDIRTAIRNSTGPRPSLFVPEVAFDLLVKPQIKLLEAPSLRCVELVYEELVKICHNCTSAVCATPRRCSPKSFGLTHLP